MRISSGARNEPCPHLELAVPHRTRRERHGRADDRRGRAEADPLPAKPDTTNRFANTFNGEFAPGAGFDLIRTKRP
jgi:hypothetical protein